MKVVKNLQFRKISGLLGDLLGDIVQKGFNSDVLVSGYNYHVQTEDWGRDNPYVVSRIFRDGAVVKSIKTPYEEIFLCTGPANPRQAIYLAMREQHQQILDLLLSGKMPSDFIK